MGPSLSIFDMIAVHGDGHPSGDQGTSQRIGKEWGVALCNGPRHLFYHIVSKFSLFYRINFIAETTAYIKSAKKGFFSNNITSFLICSCVKTITGRIVLQVGKNIGSKFKN